MALRSKSRPRIEATPAVAQPAPPPERATAADLSQRRGASSFFEDKNRAFWLLQGGGWFAYFVLRTFSGFSNSMGWRFVLPSLAVTLAGFSVTLLMAASYRRVITMRPWLLWSLVTVILAVASGVYSVLEVWAHTVFYESNWRPKGIEFLGGILLPFAVLGAWTGLYFGINYYLLLGRQAERLRALAAQASTAQLEMLRYQINPHFLFNTLNSISTLVLLQQTDRANAMLSRLSSFLRYSLVGEQEGMATLAQEYEALKLYLEIERTRFEERLRTRFEIEPLAETARIPSLLLQPLVENAVKYAVTPQEDGAEIEVTARVIGDRLAIRVADTGPGLPETGPAPTHDGTGVGLGNIRERLAQAFGPDHRFELTANQPSGLVVIIDVPFRPASDARASSDAAPMPVPV